MLRARPVTENLLRFQPSRYVRKRKPKYLFHISALRRFVSSQHNTVCRQLISWRRSLTFFACMSVHRCLFLNILLPEFVGVGQGYKIFSLCRFVLKQIGRSCTTLTQNIIGLTWKHWKAAVVDVNCVQCFCLFKPQFMTWLTTWWTCSVNLWKKYGHAWNSQEQRGKEFYNASSMGKRIQTSAEGYLGNDEAGRIPLASCESSDMQNASH